MEFFQLHEKTHGLQMSPQIWIYFVTAGGTTILTMALYYVMAGLPQIRRRQNGDIDKAKYDHIPCSLQQGYTDIEKNLQTVGTK
jgi:hypothetical protein